MSIQTTGGWLDSISDFFTGGSTPDYTSYYSTPTPTTTVDPFGFDLGLSPITSPGYTPDLGAYLNTGYSGATVNGLDSTTSSNFFSDLSSGVGDFFNGVTGALSGLTGLFNAGLGAYAGLQQVINQTNPQDKIVQVPGTNTVVVQRGNGDLVPILQAYPNLAGALNQAEQSKTTQTLLIAGALGLGLIVLLKDNKKR